MESLFEAPRTRAGIEPRDYLLRDHDESFRLWDSGVVGVLTRAATGLGKTPMSCAKADTWMQRGENHHVMIVSYEQNLVWQFAQEIEDFLGIVPGIEMGTSHVDPEYLPRVVVVSRASLLRAPEPLPEQIEELQAYGITDLGPTPARTCKRFLKFLREGGDSQDIKDEIENLKRQPEADGSYWSRLHKFDWRKNWLIIYDEAHRHAYKLSSVGPIVDWFERNPNSRRSGITATPKRSDGVSIGDKMFPGIALDFPLYSPIKPCGVKEGWAVPYIQKYIQVEGIDFHSLAKVGSDFDEAELEKKLGEESTLATLILPLLDMVGDRSTLIFSPGVQMAKDVATFINARVETKCSCGKVKWYPRLLVGDGATCQCGTLIASTHITKDGEQARELDGSSPDHDRKRTYQDHKNLTFQFLSVCGLCIAKDSLILTDRGEMPIQNVTTEMKLWDGVEFVTHEGVIFKGHRQVIEYAGLTATENHNVWTNAGWKSMAECKQQGLAIAVAGIDGRPVRESDGYYRRDFSSRQETNASFRSAMQWMSKHFDPSILPIPIRKIGMQSLRVSASKSERLIANLNAKLDRQNLLQTAPNYNRDDYSCHDEQQGRIGSLLQRLRQEVYQANFRIEKRTGRMQELLQVIRCSELAIDAVSLSEKTMRESQRCVLSRLRRAWNKISVCFSDRYGIVDHEEFGIAQRLNSGPKEQSRTLRSWQSSMGKQHGTSEQQATPKKRVSSAEVYDILNAGPRHRFTANGLIVSNCREGHNDPNISCVAIFRPVSKEASSLAEQMKGRACRPLKGILRGLTTKEERLEAIANSAKPNALIVDLVGVTGLADCASTASIYADGLADELKEQGHDEDQAERIAEELIERATEILAERGLEGEVAVEDAINQARREDQEQRDKVRQEREQAEERAREEAERRAKAGAEVRYSEHDVGHGGNVDPNAATDAQYRYASMLGMEIKILRSKKQLGRIIDMLQCRVPMEEIAHLNRIHENDWEPVGPSPKQINFMKWKKIPTANAKTKYDASLLIDAKLEPQEFFRKRAEAIQKAKSPEQLSAIGVDMKLVQGILDRDTFAAIVEIGKAKRAELAQVSEAPIPE